MTIPHPFPAFLQQFVPLLAAKSKQVNQATWLLETTGSKDAAELCGDLHTELKLLYSDEKNYKQLLSWSKNLLDLGPDEKNQAKRQLAVLLRSFKENQIPSNLLKEIADKEAILAFTYANFRPTLDGKPVSENEIREKMRAENVVSHRTKIWESSKQVGSALAPQIIALVKLRNKAAIHLGYKDYFHMQLELQEVDAAELFSLLDDLEKNSAKGYQQVIHHIEEEQSRHFGVDKDKLGPWAWSEPFCQEDPLPSCNFDSFLANIDICKLSEDLYRRMGIDVSPTLSRSDMWERPGKNQHAFCINVDRGQDVRTLNNVKPTGKWLETVLHELGHAIYDLGFDSEKLPWLLREPPHMITTEAMALLAGRKAYLPEVLSSFIKEENLLQDIAEGARRRQLIFSRFVLVMTYFERALYENPDQDLNALWWKLVHKHQKILPPTNRQQKQDWAAKYHIGIAPVYYYSYLLGELFASSIEKRLEKETNSGLLFQKPAGLFLQKNLFAPGNSKSWSELVRDVIGEPLSADAWIEQFMTKEHKK